MVVRVRVDTYRALRFKKKCTKLNWIRKGEKLSIFCLCVFRLLNRRQRAANLNGLVVRKCLLAHWRKRIHCGPNGIYLFPFRNGHERARAKTVKMIMFALCANLSKCIARKFETHAHTHTHARCGPIDCQSLHSIHIVLTVVHSLNSNIHIFSIYSDHLFFRAMASLYTPHTMCMRCLLYAQMEMDSYFRDLISILYNSIDSYELN